MSTDASARIWAVSDVNGEVELCGVLSPKVAKQRDEAMTYGLVMAPTLEWNFPLNFHEKTEREKDQARGLLAEIKRGHLSRVEDGAAKLAHQRHWDAVEQRLRAEARAERSPNAPEHLNAAACHNVTTTARGYLTVA